MSKSPKNPINEENENSNETEQKSDSTTSNDNQLLPEQKIAELQAKLDEANDKYLRLYSDFDNYRKRTAKEKIDWIKTAGEDIFTNLLPVVDDFERAVKSNASINDIKIINEGVNLIYTKFKNTLVQKGLEEMKAIGVEFNADMHEAITSIPAPSEDMKGKIVEEVEKGYLLNGKIIRYAKVIIGN